MHQYFATVCGFHQNAQKLTGNTKKGNFEYCD